MFGAKIRLLLKFKKHTEWYICRLAFIRIISYLFCIIIINAKMEISWDNSVLYTAALQGS